MLSQHKTRVRGEEISKKALIVWNLLLTSLSFFGGKYLVLQIVWNFQLYEIKYSFTFYVHFVQPLAATCTGQTYISDQMHLGELIEMANIVCPETTIACRPLNQ